MRKLNYFRLYQTARFLFLLLPLAIDANSAEPTKSIINNEIDDTINRSLPKNAHWSLQAVDLSTGKEIVSLGNFKDELLIPGSLIKLFTTAALLECNEKNKINLDTIIAHDGHIVSDKLIGNVYIKGKGNALLSESDLKTVVNEFIAKGIKEISGNIIADDSFFDGKNWHYDHATPSRAKPGALGLDLHTIAINFDGSTLTARIEPSNDDVKIKITSTGKLEIRQIDDLTYEVTGAQIGARSIKKRFSLQDPALYTAGTLRTLLVNNGISVRRNAKTGTMPDKKNTQFYSIRSPHLSQIIQSINFHSINVFSENILLLLGSERSGLPGTREKGVNAVKDLFKDNALLLNNIELADGSGLSPDNKITAKVMVDFLKTVARKQWFNTFYESLPRVGIDGTLKDVPYKNEYIRVKTGQLRDVFSLAGYVKGAGGKQIAFTYLVNVPGADLLWKDMPELFKLLDCLANE